MKITEYLVANDLTLTSLVKQVNILIKQGYQPLGSIVVAESGRYYQTMVR